MTTFVNSEYVVPYCNVVADLLKNDLVNSMRTYNHHGKISTHFHSVFVSYNVFSACRRLKLSDDDTRDITKAALLHDFYLYDWHITKHEEKHAWYHPKAAAANVNKFLFTLTPMQEDMILHHMFPLTSAPRCRGGWILTMADKHCANLEIAGLSKGFLPVYNKILKECDVDYA